MRAEISIIIPVYNVENYLRQCLDSILNQTFQDFEIICVDDGSTDKSLEILEEYKKKDDRFVILRQNHLGAGAARNLGLKSAKGKYVQFLDSDDYFEKDMLEELYKRAIKYNSDMVVCSSRKVDEEGNIIESGNPNSPINMKVAILNKVFCGRDYKETIFSMFNVSPWNKLYLREMLISSELKFQNISSCNDVFFGHISKICANRIYVFNKELINYRSIRRGNISECRADCSHNIILAALEMKDYLVKNNLYSEYKKTWIQAIKAHICWEISKCNQKQYDAFVSHLKDLMPNDWYLFNSVLRKDYITPEYIKKFIGNKKVMLWGASLFIKKVFETEKLPNPNILGFIDKNNASWGVKCGNYKIYSPNELNDLKPDGVILTVYSDNENIYKHLKKEFKTNYPKIELLPNIFEGEVIYE